jgi:hypothetical protein
MSDRGLTPEQAWAAMKEDDFRCLKGGCLLPISHDPPCRAPCTAGNHRFPYRRVDPADRCERCGYTRGSLRGRVGA